MTTNSINRTAPEPALRLRSPDAVIAAVPYLLGFQPYESLVIVWLRRNQVLMTLRVDLPPQAYTGDHGELSQTLAGAAANTAADEVIICIFSDTAGDGKSPNQSLVTKLMVDFYGIGVEVRDALLVRYQCELASTDDGGQSDSVRWWSYLGDEGYEQVAGRHLDPQVVLDVRSRFALEGIAALPVRGDLSRALDHDVSVGSRVNALISELSVGLTKYLADAELAGSKSLSDALANWRNRGIDALVTLVLESDGRQLSDQEIAEVVFSLGDIRIRDTLLWHLVRSADRHAAFGALATALRGAPPGWVAPIATCTSICSWLMGDGARALIAMDRAIEADDQYSLAQLVAQGLAAGLPPAFWTAAMAEVTEEQCRSGGGGFVT